MGGWHAWIPIRGVFRTRGFEEGFENLGEERGEYCADDIEKCVLLDCKEEIGWG